jgi:hypothetical protein
MDTSNLILGAIIFWSIIAAVAAHRLLMLAVIDPVAMWLNAIYGRPRAKSEPLGALSWNVNGYTPKKDGDHGF